MKQIKLLKLFLEMKTVTTNDINSLKQKVIFKN